MTTPNRHILLTRWLLLACFVMQAVVGVGHARFALCLGCPDTGLSVVRSAAGGGTDAASFNADHCCDSDYAPGAAPVSGFPATPGDDHASECGCVDVNIEVTRHLAVAQPRASFDELCPAGASPADALPIWAMDLGSTPDHPAAARSLPPPRSDAPLGARAQTLVTLRTCLII